MTVAERRQALYEWLYADEERNGWTTTEITSQARFLGTALDERTGSLIYPLMGRLNRERERNRAYRDLQFHVREGNLTRGQTGGKATWWYA